MHAPPGTVDEYIAGFSPNIQAVLREVRSTVKAAAPLAEERISYRMPAFFHSGVVVYFGAFKNHLGLFPPVSDTALLAKVAEFAGPKGNLQFPYAKPIPLKLIAAIVKSRVKANAAKAKAKAKTKAKAKAGKSGVA